MKLFHRFSLFTAVCGALLIFAGALVTSTGSGLSVPDWPLSYGTFFPKMQGGVFFEHGHRLIAGFVATLTLVTAAWAYLKVQSSLIRKLCYVAAGAVLLQAILGGMTVLLQLPTWTSVAHACLGQSYFCVLCSIALLSSKTWQNATRDLDTKTLLPHLTLVFVIMVFIQLFLGAWMRHIGAGLAIPDFPTSLGSWIPPIFTYWIKVHFAHRVGALCITIYFIFFALYAAWMHRRKKIIRIFLYILFILILTQVTLGSFVIWTGKNAFITSLHVVCGASILGTLVLMCLMVFHLFNAQQSYLLLLDYISLGKPRITIMVCMTAFVGFFLASKGEIHSVRLIWTLISVFLVSFGSCSLNQVMEITDDQAMDRTKNRPLAAGRLTAKQGMGVSVATVLAGLAVMYLQVNWIAFIFVLISFLGYILFYTPLKKITNLNTLVGAVPGALPPVIGWVAASGSFTYQALLLFMIMFFWQLPHFLAIAWMFADDYKKAQMRMLPHMDPHGERTTRQALLYTLALIPVGLLPSFVGLAGRIYFFATLLISLWFLKLVFGFFRNPDKAHARKVLLGSLVYLSLVFALLVLDRA